MRREPADGANVFRHANAIPIAELRQPRNNKCDRIEICALHHAHISSNAALLRRCLARHRCDVRGHRARIFFVQPKRRHWRQRMRTIWPNTSLQECRQLLFGVASRQARDRRRNRRPRNFNCRREHQRRALQRVRHVWPLRRHRRVTIVAAADVVHEILAPRHERFAF